ncbi:hypothetical protein X752_14595 [Mesorhizobium sp. LNJC398B00]|nr:hypothetical protein X752_14595 [Mesorhizobium sp. LNJC398B00]
MNPMSVDVVFSNMSPLPADMNQISELALEGTS